mmetsp:Transcript_18397/g.47124  ORF Transcript_18397/g.47124 Transcript_18397/m.47124 type:complete len:318 (-) Transcript_18397:306-1259(-)
MLAAVLAVSAYTAPLSPVRAVLHRHVWPLMVEPASSLPPLSGETAGKQASFAGTVVPSGGSPGPAEVNIDEWLCPITSELPQDPVMAEDGHTYEKHALIGWFKRTGMKGVSGEMTVKSPVTKELMGDRIFPAQQVRKSIKALVQSGAISGPKALAWQIRIEDEDKLDDTRRSAEAGNVEAMREMGVMYRRGEHGLIKDEKMAFTWYKRAADRDDVAAQIACAECFLNGEGVARNEARALMMLVRAAEAASEYACYVLGSAHQHGTWVLDKDAAEAALWFSKMQRSTLKDAADFQRSEAQNYLRSHEASSSDMDHRSL